MGFAKLFTEIFRDYETDGVPSSGPHSPIKADIRNWGATVETRLAVGARVARVDADMTVQPNDFVIVVRRTVAGPSNMALPASADFLGAELVVKDGKGDASVNAITLVPNGTEKIDALAGNPQILSNRGVMRLAPDPDGGWAIVSP